MNSSPRSVIGPAAIVAAISIGVWWVRAPGLTSIILVPPLFLGVGVGVVARYSTARPAALVVTAAVTTSVLFGVGVASWSADGIHGEALGGFIVIAACIVAEATLAAAVGARVGRTRRDRELSSTPAAAGD